MRISSPPTYAPMADKSGIVSLPWLLFFNSLFTGDTGTEWTPSFVALTETGTATLTGKYFRLGGKLVYFRAIVTPATDTSAVAGTTYIDNFPLAIDADGQCLASSAAAGSTEAGAVVASSGRIYVPAWTLIATPVTITGLIEAH
jgi:hypothetical protein